jgi:hypothetical protein
MGQSNLELDLDLDLDDLTEVDVDAQEEDLEEERGGRGNQKREQYYPGRGKNIVRNIAVRLPKIGDDGEVTYESKVFIKTGVHDGKKTGLKEKDRGVNIPCFQEMAWAIPLLLHQTEIDIAIAKRDGKNDAISKLTEELGLLRDATTKGESLDSCFVDEIRQRSGARLQKKFRKEAWKKDVIKSLWPNLRQWGMILLCEDSATCQECHGIESLKTNCQVCSGDGWKDKKRHDKEGYENGQVYQARFEFGSPQMAQKILDWGRDPELGKPPWDARRGYDVIMQVSASEKKAEWNEYAIDRKQNPSRLGEYSVLIGDPKKNKGKDLPRKHLFNFYSEGEEAGEKAVKKMILDASRQILNVPDLQNLRRVLLQKAQDEKEGGKWKLKERFEAFVKAKTDKLLGLDNSGTKSDSQPAEKKDDVKVDSSYSKPKTIETPDEKPVTKSPENPPSRAKSETVEADPPPSESIDTSNVPTVDFDKLKGLPPPGSGVKYSNGLVVIQPVEKTCMRPEVPGTLEDGARACSGLFYRRQGPGANQCLTNCPVDTMKICAKDFATRKRSS